MTASPLIISPVFLSIPFPEKSESIPIDPKADATPVAIPGKTVLVKAGATLVASFVIGPINDDSKFPPFFVSLSIDL